MSEILVSATQHPADLGRAIWAELQRDGETVHVKAIGAAAVNQAVKGIAIVRGYLVPLGIEAIFQPHFEELDGGLLNEAMTGIVLVVSRR